MKYLNLHTHKQSKEKNTLEIVNYDLITSVNASYYSAGIHPWCIQENLVNKQLNELKASLNKANCLALGECGLDKNITIDLAFQKEVFIQQLELNKQFNKPVIIHCVKAFQEIISIRKKYAFPFIIHGFNKKLELAQQLIKNDIYLSFGETFLRNERLQKVFKELPLEKVFLETDDSQIAIQEVYEKAVQIKKMPLKDLIRFIEKNHNQL